MCQCSAILTVSSHASGSRRSDSSTHPTAIPQRIVEDLGLPASAIQNPSKETLDTIFGKYDEALGLLQTAQSKLSSYGHGDPLVLPSTSTSHCVRCHENYLESCNTNGSCKIGHRGDFDLESGSTWVWNGCGCSEECDSSEGLPDGDGLCFKGLHTTHTSEVDYTDDKRYYEGIDGGAWRCKVKSCKTDNGPASSRKRKQ